MRRETLTFWDVVRHIRVPEFVSEDHIDAVIITLRPRQNGRHFPDDIFKCIFLNENVWISINISLKFLPEGPINNIPALVQMMAWRQPGDKPLSEPMMVRLPTHICVTRPQWVIHVSPSSVWVIFSYHALLINTLITKCETCNPATSQANELYLYFLK